MKNLLILSLCAGLCFAVSAGGSKSGKSKTGERAGGDEKIDTTNMQKDYDELMKLYKDLKTKAEAFKKNYKMLPPELMPLIMKQGMGMGPGGQGGMGGGQGGMGGGQGAGMMPPGGQNQDRDIFE